MITIHLTILTFTILVILFADFNGLLWVLGKKETLSKTVFLWAHRLVSLGLFGMIVTGGIMAYGYGPEVLLRNFVFSTKMLFVLLLVINAFFIGRHMYISFDKKFSEATIREKRALIVSGIISTTSWISVFMLGKMLF